MPADTRLIIHGPPDIIKAIKADLLTDKTLWADDDLYRQSKNPNYAPSTSSLALNALIKYFKKRRGEIP